MANRNEKYVLTTTSWGLYRRRSLRYLTTVCIFGTILVILCPEAKSQTGPAQAATPSISLASGVYSNAQTLTITDVTPGATIYYTTDGSAPTMSSTVYTGALTVSSAETLEAIAAAPGYLASSAAIANYIVGPDGGWIDDFQSYSPGNFPSANWTASGNSGTRVVNSPVFLSSRSAQLYGQVGGCWGALIHRPLKITASYTIQFYAYNGRETLSGCHPSRAQVQLNTQPTWTSPVRTLATFSSDGHFLDGNNNTGPQFPLQTWVKVRIAYERPSSSTVRLTYWLNDQYFDTIEAPSNSYESQLAYLSLSSGEGTSYFDNVSVTAGGADSLLPNTTYFHGVEVLSWTAPSSHGISASAKLALSGPVTQIMGTGLNANSSMSWDTTTVPDGNYQLTLTFLDASGSVVASVNKSVLVNNSVTWHSGTVTSNQTWSSDTVHVIDANLLIPAGVTVTIQPGTIVKLVPGVGITVQAGGILNATGTSTAPIVFTSIDDSTVGGDTTLNGGTDVPSSAQWDGVSIQGNGQFNANSDTVLLYWQAIENGALTGNQTWAGPQLYQVTGNVVIPSGVTLTIQPGAIVKFAANTGITVQTWGSLIANGTVAQPIYFTSLNDDSVGGDTNGDGNATSPGAGDWGSIVVNGATASFSYVQMSYGGGPVNSSNVIGMIQSTGSSKVTISNSSIAHSFWDGVLTGYPGGGDVVTVSGSVINGVEGRGINAWPGSTVHAVNDTFDNDGVGVFVHGGTVDIADTIISNTHGTSGWGAVEVCCGGNLLSVSHSDVWANAPGVANYGGVSDPTGSNGNISANPVYVNGPQGNYRLNYGSPAIDAADGKAANYSFTDIAGDPRYNDPETANKKGIADANGNYPDMGAYEFIQNGVSNIDFTVNSVTGPASALAGDQVQITWTDINTGSGTVIGPWHDSIYLVQNPGANPVELFAAQVLVGNGAVMGPGSSSTNTATIRVPGSTVGNQRWEVRTNTAGDIFEGQNISNNSALSLNDVAIDLPQLPVNGAALSNSFAAAGQSWWYKLIPGPGQTIGTNLSLSGNAGGVQLFIGQGYVPTPQQFDIQAQPWNAPSVSAEIPNTSTQIYYVTAYAQRLPSTPAPFTISASSQQFSLSSVEPGSIVNSGNATIEFIGAQLSAHATYQIVGANGTVYTGSSVYVSDSAHVYATFAASGLAAGLYSAQVTENGSTLTLKNALTVTALPAQPVAAGQIAYNIEVPEAVRAGYGGVVTVHYQNTGSADVVAPLMALTTTGAVTTFAAADLSRVSPNYQTLYTTIPGQGQFLGINETGGPAGVLPAGAEGSVSLNFTAGTGSNVQFGLYTVTDPAATIDWGSAKSSMRPSWISPDAWSAIFANFTAQVGSTWGSYNAALAADATYLGQLGIQEYRISQLQSFELMKAGLNTISRRYFLGAFGRGASHPFDISGVTTGTGYLFQYPNGSVRAFVPNPSSPGHFIGGIGDYATLVSNSSDRSILLTEQSGIVYHFAADPHNAARVILDYIQDLNGNRVRASYTDDLVTSVTTSTGDTLTFTYDSNGRITQTTDPVGRVTTYAYDSADQHLLSVTTSSGTISMTYITGLGPAQEHALQSVTGLDGVHTYYGYDSQGRVISIQKDGGAQPLTMTYAQTGAVTVADAYNNSWQFSPDASGSLARIIDPLGNLTQMQYDPEEKLIRTIAPDGATTSLTYDANGNPAAEKDPLGNQLGTQFAANGDLLGLSDALGNSTKYGYDSHYNATSIKYPDTRQVQATYDSRGNVTSFTNRRGQTLTYTWDGNNLLTQKTHANGATVSYTYDAHRNLQSVSDGIGTTTFTYDLADRILQVTYPNGRFVKYAYDSGGRRSSLSDQTGYTVNYAYDAIGRLSRVTSGSGAAIAAYSYDNDGRVSQKTLGNGAYTTYNYDTAGNVIHLINYSSQSVINSRFDYSYDANGRKVTMTTLDGQSQYGYDADGQLTSVTPSSGSVVQYTYDAAGNRVTTVSGTATTDFNVNNLNQYTAVGGFAYSYDADGNLISKQTSAGTWTYAYDDEGHLVSASGPGGSWVYQYDSFGNRISSVNGGTTTEYLVDPTGIGNVEGEFDGHGQVVSQFANGLGLESSVLASGVAAFYQFDDSGNTAAVTGANGSVMDAYSFLPFGEKVNDTVTAANPFDYVGQFGVADDRNGLYYMRARYYDTDTGRYISEDPVGLIGGTNVYEYVNNTPGVSIDPIGLLDFGDACAAISCVSIVKRWEQVSQMASGAGTGFDVVESERKGGTRGVLCGALPEMCSPEVGLDLIGFAVKGRWGLLLIAAQFAAKNSDIIYNYFSSPSTWSNVNICSYGGCTPLALAPCMVSGTACSLPSAPSRSPTQIQNLPVPHSLDPNGKITVGYGSQGFIPPGATITYTIYFENQSSATAPAASVVVTDALDSNLDWSTVQLSQIAFNNVTLSVPAGLQNYTTQTNVSTSPYPVNVGASLNPDTGTLSWTMQSIDPRTGGTPQDPFAGFLPPDNASRQGEGFVTFTVKPKMGLANGTVISNQASIVFDRNAAINTNTVTNTIDSIYPSSGVSPLPATEPSFFAVSWSGSDPDGSGIASYDVYFSIDSGPYTAWQVATTATTATFAGAPGHSYSFYSMATDNVGRRQQTPGPAQTTATGPAAVSAPSIASGGVVPIYSSSTTIQPGEWITIYGANLAAAPVTWSGDFPATLGGTTVTIDGKSTYIWFVSPTQINLQAPDDSTLGPVSVVVTTSAGTATATVNLAQFAPSFSLLDGNHVAGIILRADGSGTYGGGSYDIIGPTGNSLGYGTVAAKAGDVVELFGVGFGPTSPAVPAGQALTEAAATTNAVQITIGGASVKPLFAGLTAAGLYQINLIIPNGIGTGDVPLSAMVSGAQTQSGVVISLQ